MIGASRQTFKTCGHSEHRVNRSDHSILLLRPPRMETAAHSSQRAGSWANGACVRIAIGLAAALRTTGTGSP